MSNFEQARFNMVEQQIRPWDVANPRVLETLLETPREKFVPEGFEGAAYADISIPLGNGQSMSHPRLGARAMQALDIQKTDDVLEIGTGSGYLTACLAQMGRYVKSMDCEATLVEQARKNLQTAGVINAEVNEGDIFTDLPAASFDVIVINGAINELDSRLKHMLNPGGRLYCVMGEAPIQTATLVSRTGTDSWKTEELFETECDMLKGCAEPERFDF